MDVRSAALGRRISARLYRAAILNRSVLRGISKEDLEATDRVLTALGKRMRGMLNGDAAKE